MAFKVREELKARVGNNYSCKGKFIKYDRIGNSKKMLLLDIVTFHGETLSDHVWIDAVDGFEYGDIVNFSGKVKPYVKNLNGSHVVDYGFRKIKYVYKAVK